jgi:ubiquitin-like 1-activating enzyme E1 B
MPDGGRLVGFVNGPGLDALYGIGAAKAVSSAHVLVVGAGGVGCELVKNLGSAGFARITLIDLDTIDVSNLNRQFLFRRIHVGCTKAEVAARAVEAMVDGLEVEGLVGNVKEARFDVEYFRRFDVVCNALDNLDARRHVNRMCLSAETVLIESGSTGYNGQVTVIKRGKECYDCYPKPAPKTYAVCTIRSTPEKPIHCVVWAKHLWELVFGADDESNVLRDLDGGGAGGDHAAIEDKDVVVELRNGHDAAGDLQGESETPAQNAVEGKRPKAKRVRFETGEDGELFANRVCTRVFVDDIEDQVAMKTLWEKRPPPTPYDVSASADAMPANLSKLNLLETRVWSAAESAAVLKAVLMHIVEKRTSEVGSLSFDKDDADALAFVVASSNLRAAAYGLELQSPFTIKGIAGNIVHAIATTNAMVAGLIVLETIKVVANKGGVHGSLTTFVRKTPTGNPGRRRALLCSERINDPNPSCYVCSKGMLQLAIDVEKTSLRMFIERVCKMRLGVIEPTVTVKTGEFYNTLFEAGEGLEDDEIDLYDANLTKSLNALRVESGSQLDIDDGMQSFQCSILVKHVADILNDVAQSDRFELTGQVSLPKEETNDELSSTGIKQEPDGYGDGGDGADNDDDVVEEVPIPAGKKRPSEYMLSDEFVPKKRKVVGQDDAAEEVEVID